MNDIQYQEFLDKIHQSFTPFKPVELVELFKGRNDVISRVVTELDSPGRNIILYGDRGVGKTSLANLTWFFSNSKRNLLVHRCSATSTFDTIFADVLAKLGVTHVEGNRTSTRRRSVGISGTVGIDAGLSNSVELQNISGQFGLSPQFVCSHLSSCDGLLVLDEYDRIDNSATNTAVADLVKHLADSGSSTKLMIVGVSESVSDLIGSHPSIARSLAEIKMPRMADAELLEIVEDGFRLLEVRCPTRIAESMVKTSDGFPHFTHLLGLKISLALARRLSEQKDAGLSVTEDDYNDGLTAAIDGSQESLKVAYRRATETVRRKSDGYVQVLEAMAIETSSTEVQLSTLLKNINELFGLELHQQNISNYMGKLVNERRVLVRPRTGFYKFRDPMMRAYIRMKMGNKRLSGNATYQKEFSFMEKFS